jgi:hypothetical protein
MSYIPNLEKFVVNSSGQITGTEIQDLSITTSDIANSAVTYAKRSALNYVKSAKFTATTNSTTPTTAQTIVITTSGRPVWLGLQSDYNATTSSGRSVTPVAAGTISSLFLSIRILRNGTPILYDSVGLIASTTSNAPILLQFPVNVMSLDLAPAGTNTYELQTYVNNPSVSGDIKECVFMAYEL